MPGPPIQNRPELPTPHCDRLIESGAVFSPCLIFRYRLWWTWAAGPRVAFIGLNPSTADATADDPTVRRCIGFARAWGYGGVDVVNLFAFRATEPRVLKRAVDPNGPDNNDHLFEVAKGVGRVVAAWGVHGTHCDRDDTVLELLRAAGVKVSCLSRTRAGYPRHPLYAKASLRCRPFGVRDKMEPRPGGSGRSLPVAAPLDAERRQPTSVISHP
jgi:hypothetical protein